MERGGEGALTSLSCHGHSRVKLSASLKWLLYKAYDGQIPADFREPLVKQQDDNVSVAHINVGVRSLLANSKLYCAACQRLFASWGVPFNGHWSVIQSLSRRGFYIIMDESTAVGEADLTETQPFNTHAHLAVMDAIMVAYLTEMAPVAAVVQAVRAVTAFTASKDLPCSTEDALLLWISKVWSLTCERRQKARQLQLRHVSPQIVRLNRSQLTPGEREPALSLQTDGLLEQLKDGCCLAVVVSHYFPENLRMEDICLVSTGSTRDAECNWHLISRFCQSHAGSVVAAGVHFSAEDIVQYGSSQAMKPNVLVLAAELFATCAASEACRLPSAPPAGSSNVMARVATTTAAIVCSTSSDLISDATKRSFVASQRSASATSEGRMEEDAESASIATGAVRTSGREMEETDAGEPGLSARSANTYIIPQKKPLLSKRQKESVTAEGVTKTVILSYAGAHQELMKQSTTAWEDKNGSCTEDGDRLETYRASCEMNRPAGHGTSRWGIFKCGKPEDCAPTNILNLGLASDSAQTVALSSTVGDALDAVGRASSQTSLLNHPVSPVSSVNVSQCIDRECFQIMSASQDSCQNNVSPRLHTPGTARSLVSNAMLWQDDDDENNAIASPGQSDIRRGFFLCETISADGTQLSTGNCSSAGEKGCSLQNHTSVDIGDRCQLMTAQQGCEAAHLPEGITRTTSFAELKQLSSTTSAAATPRSADERLLLPPCNNAGGSTTVEHRVPVTDWCPPPVLAGGVSLKAEYIKAKSDAAGIKLPKKTTFALKQTTWVESAKLKDGAAAAGELETSTSSVGSQQSDCLDGAAARQHADVKLMLAEKRRAIEAGRQNASAARGEEHEEISREAFLQAVLKRSAGRESRAAERTLMTEAALSASGGAIIHQPAPTSAISSEPPAATVEAAGGSARRISAPITLGAEEKSALAQPNGHLSAGGSAETASWAAEVEDDDAVVVEDYSASLDKLSSSLSELQHELARLALKQKQFEDASVRASGSGAAAVVVSRHPVYVLSEGALRRPDISSEGAAALGHVHTAAAASAAAAAAAASVQGHLAATTEQAQVPAGAARAPAAQSRYTLPLAQMQATAVATSERQPVDEGRVSDIACVHRAVGSWGVLPSAEIAMSRHGIIHLAAEDVRQHSSAVAGTLESDSGITIAAGEVRSNIPNGGSFFIPVEAANRSLQRSDSLGSAESGQSAQQMAHPAATGKRANWCVTRPGAVVLAAEAGPAAEHDSGDRPTATADNGADDLQRRKERVMMLQQRRREEEEKKRQLKDAQTERKREELKVKEMEAERKKLEEKQRRELIFRQYKERKADDDTSRCAAESRLISAPVQLRPRSSAARRSPAANLNRHSSGATLGAVHMDLLLPSSRDALDAYGAVTHRRPMSPSLSTSDIAAISGRHSRKPSGLHGALGDSPSSSSRGLQQVAANTAAPQRLREGALPLPDSPDLVAVAAVGDSDLSSVAALKLYVQPSFKSNRGIIINAVSHCVLAGTVNTDVKNKVLEELARSDAKHFLILFRDSHLQYRGIYAYNLDTEEVSKVSGQGPKVIGDKMLERFYKYNSGSKSFSEVTSTKHLSVSIDAITIKDALWQKKAGSASSATPKRAP